MVLCPFELLSRVVSLVEVEAEEELVEELESYHLKSGSWSCYLS